MTMNGAVEDLAEGGSEMMSCLPFGAMEDSDEVIIVVLGLW